MTATEDPTAPVVTGRPEPTPRGAPVRRRARWPRPRRVDVLVAAGYLVASLYVMGHLLVDPNGRVQRANPADQGFFEFALAHSARVLAHGANPLFTRQMNMPDGVNMMANTSVLGMALPLAPVTLLLGTGVAYALLCVVALAATATSWYAMLARHVVRSRFAAAVGGWFCAFAPGAIAQSNGHPNIVAQFLVPWIVAHATTLREPGRTVRKAVALAALVIWQFFINEEILLLVAVAYGIVAVVYAVAHRRTVGPQARRLVRGVLLAGAMSAVLLAYPLWFQFFGPQHYRGLPPLIRLYGIDAWSYPSYASESLTGNVNTGSLYAPNPAEQNAFLGWGLVILLAVIVWRLRRNALVVGLAVAGVSLAVCSLGVRIVVHGRRTDLPGPWALLSRLPMLDTVVAPRLAVTIIPIVGMLLALGCDAYLGWVATRQGPVPPLRLVGGALLAVALVPIAPTPLAAVGRTPVPAFITSGEYKRYVPEGRSLVPVPLTRPPHNDGLFFAARANLGFAFPRGYFLGPGPDPDHPGKLGARYDAPYRPTSSLLEAVANTGVEPPLGPDDSAAALADLRFWRAAALILPFDSKNEYPLYQVTSELVGFRPTPVGGVWLWDVRGLVPPP